jgi:hypothetical protein
MARLKELNVLIVMLKHRRHFFKKIPFTRTLDQAFGFKSRLAWIRMR